VTSPRHSTPCARGGVGHRREPHRVNGDDIGPGEPYHCHTPATSATASNAERDPRELFAVSASRCVRCANHPDWAAWLYGCNHSNARTARVNGVVGGSRNWHGARERGLGTLAQKGCSDPARSLMPRFRNTPLGCFDLISVSPSRFDSWFAGVEMSSAARTEDSGFPNVALGLRRVRVELHPLPLAPPVPKQFFSVSSFESISRCSTSEIGALMQLSNSAGFRRPGSSDLSGFPPKRGNRGFGVHGQQKQMTVATWRGSSPDETFRSRRRQPALQLLYNSAENFCNACGRRASFCSKDERTASWTRFLPSG